MNIGNNINNKIVSPLTKLHVGLSQIWIDGKNKTLGSFDDELEAHRAYQKELQQHLKS